MMFKILISLLVICSTIALGEVSLMTKAEMESMWYYGIVTHPYTIVISVAVFFLATGYGLFQGRKGDGTSETEE